MYDRVREVQTAIHIARSKLAAALDEACRDGRAADCARHLTCLQYGLMSLEFTVAEAVDAARAYDAQISHDHATVLGYTYERKA